MSESATRSSLILPSVESLKYSNLFDVVVLSQVGGKVCFIRFSGVDQASSCLTSCVSSNFVSDEGD